MSECSVTGCREPRYANYAICLAHRRERERGNRPEGYVSPNLRERSTLPTKPEGTCIFGRCENPAYPDDHLCGFHRHHFSQTINVSGQGERAEEERKSALALAAMALEGYDALPEPEPEPACCRRGHEFTLDNTLIVKDEVGEHRTCKTCKKESRQRWMRENRDRRLEEMRQWRKKNQEHINEYMRNRRRLARMRFAEVDG